MTSDCPSSPDELIRLARQKQNGIISPVLPELGLGADDSGLLDLAIVIEQLVAISGGASLIQMLHACVYILEAVERGFKEKLSTVGDKHDLSADTSHQMLVDAASVGHALRCIRDLTQRPTAVLAMHHMVASPPGDTERSMLRFLVSERMLRVLEIDPEPYYAELKERHS